MDIGQGKVFERPQGGAFVGTIIDVVDMPKFATKYAAAAHHQYTRPRTFIAGSFESVVPHSGTGPKESERICHLRCWNFTATTGRSATEGPGRFCSLSGQAEDTSRPEWSSGADVCTAASTGPRE